MGDVEMALIVPLPPDSPRALSGAVKIGPPRWLVPAGGRSTPVPASSPEDWVPKELLEAFPAFSKLWEWHMAEHVLKPASSEVVNSCPACLGSRAVLCEASADWRSIDGRRRQLITERDSAQALAVAVQADVATLQDQLTEANASVAEATAARRKLVATLTLLRDSLPPDVRRKYLPAEGGGTEIAPVERPSDSTWSWMPAWRNFAIYLWAIGTPIPGVDVYTVQANNGGTTIWVDAALLRGYIHAQKLVDPEDITSMTALAMAVLSHRGNGYQAGRVTYHVAIEPGNDVSLMRRVIFDNYINLEPVIRALANMGVEDDLVWDMSLFLRNWVAVKYRSNNANSLAAPTLLDEIWPDVLTYVTKEAPRPDGTGNRVGSPGWYPRRVQFHRDAQLAARLQATDDTEASEQLAQLDDNTVTNHEDQGVHSGTLASSQVTSGPNSNKSAKSKLSAKERKRQRDGDDRRDEPDNGSHAQPLHPVGRGRGRGRGLHLGRGRGREYAPVAGPGRAHSAFISQPSQWSDEVDLMWDEPSTSAPNKKARTGPVSSSRSSTNLNSRASSSSQTARASTTTNMPASNTNGSSSTNTTNTNRRSAPTPMFADEHPLQFDSVAGPSSMDTA